MFTIRLLSLRPITRLAGNPRATLSGKRTQFDPITALQFNLFGHRGALSARNKIAWMNDFFMLTLQAV
jgi:hypothetical protein